MTQNPPPSWPGPEPYPGAVLPEDVVAGRVTPPEGSWSSGQPVDTGGQGAAPAPGQVHPAQPYPAQPYPAAQPGGWPHAGAQPAPTGYGTPTGYGVPPAGLGGPVPYPVPHGSVLMRSTNGLAIAALVLGVVWIYWIGSILAVIFGHVARSQIRRNGQAGDGLALAGLILGWVGIGILGVVIVIAVVTRPGG